MKLVILLLMLFFATQPAMAEVKKDSIHYVITEFKQAIQSKNKARFLKLFVKNKVAWHGVISEATHNMLTELNPKFAKQPRLTTSSPEVFINSIIADAAESIETSDNVVIKEDGSVAMVTFDYEMLKNGRLKNFGKENWLLIKTDAQWLITAVNFSFSIAPEWIRHQRQRNASK